MFTYKWAEIVLFLQPDVFFRWVFITEIIKKDKCNVYLGFNTHLPFNETKTLLSHIPAYDSWIL